MLCSADRSTVGNKCKVIILPYLAHKRLALALEQFWTAHFIKYCQT